MHLVCDAIKSHSLIRISHNPNKLCNEKQLPACRLNSACIAWIWPWADLSTIMNDAEVLKKHGYTLGISLGEGSYGKVKSAYSQHLKTSVAIKIINRKKAPQIGRAHV